VLVRAVDAILGTHRCSIMALASFAAQTVDDRFRRALMVCKGVCFSLGGAGEAACDDRPRQQVGWCLGVWALVLVAMLATLAGLPRPARPAVRSR
jgi:hypothetical protein